MFVATFRICCRNGLPKDRSMNCVNCGAPLELADGRTILTCAYCQSSRRLDEPSDDGDRVISLDRPTGVDCPRCEQELVQAIIDGKTARYCSNCRGILIETHIFAEVTRKRRAAYRGREMTPQPIDPDQLQQFIGCPECQQQMDVHPHYGPGRAIIDSCHRCNLVWLDNSELTTIERTPGRR